MAVGELKDGDVDVGMGGGGNGAGADAWSAVPGGGRIMLARNN